MYFTIYNLSKLFTDAVRLVAYTSILVLPVDGCK